MNHVGINPMIDRSKALHEQKEVFVRAVKERDDGLVVCGAKMVGTAAAFTHYNFVFNYGAMPLGDGDKAYLDRLVQTCLNDYDLSGWTTPTWMGPKQ